MKKILIISILIFINTLLSAQSSSLQIDQRAFQKFTPEQISVMEPYRIAQINYLMQESFFVDNQTKPCAECPTVNLENFDVTIINRHQTQRIKHYQTTPGHPIIILPWSEVKARLEEIKSFYKP